MQIKIFAANCRGTGHCSSDECEALHASLGKNVFAHLPHVFDGVFVTESVCLNCALLIHTAC